MECISLAVCLSTVNVNHFNIKIEKTMVEKKKHVQTAHEERTAMNCHQVISSEPGENHSLLASRSSAVLCRVRKIRLDFKPLQLPLGTYAVNKILSASIQFVSSRLLLFDQIWFLWFLILL